MREIKIFFRNCNGGWTVKEFGTNEEAYAFCLSMNESETSDEEEIMLVMAEGVCIYSQLSAEHLLTWEDLVGFFA